MQAPSFIPSFFDGACFFVMDESISPTKHEQLLMRMLIRNATVDVPEQALMLAILCKAVQDLFHKPGVKRRISSSCNPVYLRKLARDFFLLGHFRNFCYWVDLNPDWVIEILREHSPLISRWR